MDEQDPIEALRGHPGRPTPYVEPDGEGPGEPEDPLSAVPLTAWTEDPEVRFGIVLVTPETAAAILEADLPHHHNRALNDAFVASLQREIDAGRWVVTDSAIVVGKRGRVLNGQHRLWAIVNSGVACLVLMVTGLADENQDFMDMGRKRTAGDVLGMHGVPSGNHVAALATLVLNLDPATGSLSSVKRSAAELRQAHEADPDIVRAVRLNGVLSNSRMGKRAGAALGVYLCLRAWPEEAERFVADLAEWRVAEGTAARRYLMNATAGEYTRTDSRTLAALVVKAFNSHLDGSQSKRLSYQPGDRFPTPYTPESFRAVERRSAGAARSREETP